MPENYTGTEGTDALAAGMTVLDGNEDRRTGWLAINKARDYIVQFFNEAKAYADTKVAAIVLSWDNITGKPVHFASRSDIVVRPPGTAGTIEDAINTTFNLAASKLSSGGGTISGQLFLPNSTAASSGYTVAYINSDGRVSRGASSERYKKFISSIDPATLGDVWPDLVRYQMRLGDGSWRYGYIAERLAESEDLRPFVIYQTITEHDEDADEYTTTLALDENGNPIPDSIDFIALLLVQNAELNARVTALEGR